MYGPGHTKTVLVDNPVFVRNQKLSKPINVIIMNDLLKRIARMRRADVPHVVDTYGVSPTAVEKVLALVSRITTPSNLDGANDTLGYRTDISTTFVCQTLKKNRTRGQ